MSPPLFKLGSVSAATGIPLPTLGRWCDRKTITPSRRERNSTGSGSHRQFSHNTIVRIAIARKLIDLGIGAGRANKAAAVFADDTELFPCGKTTLIVSPTGTMAKNTFHDTPLSDLITDGVCVVLELNRVVEHVDSILKVN